MKKRKAYYLKEVGLAKLGIPPNIVEPIMNRVSTAIIELLHTRLGISLEEALDIYLNSKTRQMIYNIDSAWFLSAPVVLADTVMSEMKNEPINWEYNVFAETDGLYYMF